jgi:hypothetical protein
MGALEETDISRSLSLSLSLSLWVVFLIHRQKRLERSSGNRKKALRNREAICSRERRRPLRQALTAETHCEIDARPHVWKAFLDVYRNFDGKSPRLV